MNILKDRGIVVELALGLLICAGAYSFVARPIMQQAAQTRAHAESIVAQGVTAGDSGRSGPTITDLRESAQRVAEAARSLHDRGRPAFNEARMLTAITSLAAAHAVNVEQLQPTSAKSHRAAAPVDPDLPPPPDDIEIGYTFTIRGEYVPITAFLREFNGAFPFSAISGFRLSASFEPGAPSVVAIITSRHMTFDASSVLRVADAAVGMPE